MLIDYICLASSSCPQEVVQLAVTTFNEADVTSSNLILHFVQEFQKKKKKSFPLF
jgi:hypothetical protein